ncbi:hypothetical protein OHB12_10515 [Nocardia sp. NBC_01730]|uniref:hypothetical protein n=1 Tax=Nocardia sp. NBC_01730 TaxID=2975998 RepID=UPI002E13B857|nr:hypothetical protein OHB12_10515 [Nocardia sp. NBC_01730]
MARLARGVGFGRGRGGERVSLLAEKAGLLFGDLAVLRQTLIAALDTLPPREREIVVVRALNR